MSFWQNAHQVCPTQSLSIYKCLLLSRIWWRFWLPQEWHEKSVAIHIRVQLINQWYLYNNYHLIAAPPNTTMINYIHDSVAVTEFIHLMTINIGRLHQKKDSNNNLFFSHNFQRWSRKIPKTKINIHDTV